MLKDNIFEYGREIIRKFLYPDDACDNIVEAIYSSNTEEQSQGREILAI